MVYYFFDHQTLKNPVLLVRGRGFWRVSISIPLLLSLIPLAETPEVFQTPAHYYAHPLFDLTQNDARWSWGTVEQTTFDRFKESVTSAPVLILPDLTKPFQIEADSSDFATRAVLLQVSADDRKWHPVAFILKSLSPVERN